jgi:hypothetical protein
VANPPFCTSCGERLGRASLFYQIFSHLPRPNFEGGIAPRMVPDIRAIII